MSLERKYSGQYLPVGLGLEAIVLAVLVVVVEEQFSSLLLHLIAALPALTISDEVRSTDGTFQRCPLLATRTGSKGRQPPGHKGKITCCKPRRTMTRYTSISNNVLNDLGPALGNIRLMLSNRFVIQRRNITKHTL